MKLIIFGSGGHCGVVLDAVRKSETFEIEGLIDETIPKIGARHGYRLIVEPVNNWNAYAFFVAIGENAVRERISKVRSLKWANVFHPSAIIQGRVNFNGTFFGANSVIGNDSKVGNFCIVNTGAILEHNSSLGDFSHLCPGVVTGGWVNIGSRTMIGLNSSIRDRVTIGNNCTIGMGSVVLHDIPDNSIAYGNPCKVIQST